MQMEEERCSGVVIVVGRSSRVPWRNMKVKNMSPLVASLSGWRLTLVRIAGISQLSDDQNTQDETIGLSLAARNSETSIIRWFVLSLPPPALYSFANSHRMIDRLGRLYECDQEEQIYSQIRARRGEIRRALVLVERKAYCRSRR